MFFYIIDTYQYFDAVKYSNTIDTIFITILKLLILFQIFTFSQLRGIDWG